MKAFINKTLELFSDILLLVRSKYRSDSIPRVWGLLKSHIFMRNRPDKPISLYGYNIMYRNTIETRVILNEIFYDQLYKVSSTPAENSVILDCGANIGIASMFFSKFYPQCKIFAFEPSDQATRIFEENMRINNIQNVTLVKAAVSDVCGYADLNVPSDELMAATLSRRLDARNVSSDVQNVRTIRLQEYIDTEVFMLKLDIEGMESSVLVDIEIKLDLVRNIFIEVHYTVGDLDNQIYKIFELLQRKNFRMLLRSSSTGLNRKFSPFESVSPIDSYLIFAVNNLL